MLPKSTWRSVCGILLLSSVSPVLAQESKATAVKVIVPPVVNFSSTLTDGSGKPLTGVVGVAFSLYKDQNGGAPLWMETQNVEPDNSGHFSVMLGSANSSGLPSDIFVVGDARWLGVQVQGQAEQPRVLLLSVPYALKAADAETLGGRPPSAFLLADAGREAAGASPPKAGEPAPSKLSSVNPLVTPCSGITADGTATGNQVAKFTAPCTIHQSQIFDNGTNVGIGNTTPGAKLDVTGNAIVRGTTQVTASLTLPQTTSASIGVVDLGASPFLHACCSAAAENTFLGISAGNFTTTASHNTAGGFKALSSDTFGAENAAFGYEALLSNTTGASNTGLGHEALLSNTSGFNNTATGFSALLSNDTGHDNTAAGDSALSLNTSGSFNTATGETALSGNSTGSFNTAIGYAANVNSGNLVNATAVGTFATAAASNTLALGCTLPNCPSGTTPPKVGIGITNPSATLDVTAPNQVGLFVRGPQSGVGAGLDLLTTGTGGLQWEILDTGAFAAQGPNKLNIRNVNTGNDILTILANGQVGIETPFPDNTLTVNGSADKPGGGSWGTISDGRLKIITGTYDGGLEAVRKLTPVRYRYKEQNAMGIKDRSEHVGFVAQDVEKVIPEAVTRNSQGYLLVNNDPILWTMLNAIKQQQTQIEEITRSVSEMDGLLRRLSNQAEELEKLRHQLTNLQRGPVVAQAENQ